MYRTPRAERRSALATATATVVLVGIGSALGAGPAAAATLPATPSASKGTSSIKVYITNNSNEMMTLTSAKNPYGHWQDRAKDVPAHTVTDVSDYSTNVEGAEIDLIYLMPDGTQITLDSAVPELVENTFSGDSTTDHYTVNNPSATGWHPTVSFVVADA